MFPKSLGLLVALTLVTGASRVHAQRFVELNGRVIDSISGAPVADAIVRVPVLQRYTLTNEEGLFRLQNVPSGVQTLHIIHVGYGEQRIHLDVQPGAFHALGIAPHAVRLDPIVAADTRYVDRIMADAAQWRTWRMSGTTGPPVFWNSWGREKIVASGIDEPLDFLRAGPPRLSIRKCVGVDFAGEDRLCVGVPFSGLKYGSDPPGYGNNAGAGLMFGSRTSGRRISPSIPSYANPGTLYGAVFLDDRRLARLEDLQMYSMYEIHRVETYGYRGEKGIRLYTLGYLRLVAEGVIRPKSGIVPDAFEFPRFDEFVPPRVRRD